MASLKDLIVTGATRLIGNAYVNKIQITAISAPTASNGTTYSTGSSGQVLKSNGTSIYWAVDDNSQTVTGVKGNSESSYRTGNVNITAANIGLGNVENTKLSTWAGSGNITTIGTLSSGTVPWARLSNVPAGASKEGTVTSVGTGIGLTGGSITSSGTIKAKLRSETALTNDSAAATETSGRVYPVAVDKSGYLAVNVPWTNVNSSYLTSHQTVTNKGATLSWGATSTIATIGSTDIKVTMPANPNTNTDTLVTQTATTTSAAYEVLFSATADNTTRTETARKNSNLTFNPSTGNLTVTQINGVTVGSSPKFTDTNTWTAMVGATSSANGSVGYVNATPPKDGYNTKYLRADGTWQVPPNTGDTHYTAYLRAGASGGTANAETTTGNTYLNLVENGTNRSGVKLVPGSNMTITSNASGNVTFTATNTTYSAGTGISLSGTEFSNSGVRATTINGNYLRVNTNGTNADLTIPYATSAGTANAVAWGNVSGKPSTSITWGAGTTNGPTLTVTAAGSSSSALAIPTASETASGIVTNGNQIFRGRKGFGDMSRYGKSDTGGASQYIADTYLFNSAGTQVGEFWYDIGNATNITKGQYYFRQFSPNSTANTATTGKHETYTLPNVTSGLTENKSYSILTSKSAVAVNQGGTGATTASNARKNLGALGSKLANSYEGMTAMDGTDSVWIRTTTLGIIPYQSGGAGSGHSALGTSGWRFSTSYIDTMYGNAINATPVVRSSDFGTDNPVTANKSGVAGQLYFMYVN